MDVIVQGQPSIEIGFERKVVDSYKSLDSALSDTSQNPVTNAAITAEIRRQDAAIEGISEANETFKGEVSESMDAFKEEVNAEIADKADKRGYFPQMHVGLSDNLPDRGDVTEGLLGFRESAGAGNSIEDGTANVVELCGESVVWNQKYEWIENPNTTNSEVITASLKNNELVINVLSAIPSMYSVKFAKSKRFEVSHKYLIVLEPSNNLLPYMGYNSGAGAYLICEEGYFSITTSIVTLKNGNFTGQFFLGTSVPVGTYKVRLGFHDLTLMFGAGNEPTTVDEFYARANQLVGVDMYAYNEGEVLGVNIKGIKSVNDNAFNGEYAKVLGGREYCADGSITSMGFAKEIGGATEAIVLDSENKFTPMENGYVYASGTDICIHLVHTGYKDHVYTPHEESESSFDLTPYFPYGMHGVNGVRDSVTKSKAVRRYGMVDMGSMSWSVISGRFGCRDIPDGIKSFGVGKKANMLCKRYRVVETGYDSDTYPDKSFFWRRDISGVIVADSSYTDAASFKAAMSGVYLIYELATPIETEIDPQLNMNYKVWDFGTEELLTDSKSAPVFSRIIYGFNATDTIRGNKAKNEEQDARLHTLESEVVRKGDYSPSNTVGYADRLVGHGESVPVEFSFRASGGKSILDGAARVKELRGNGVVWNQLIKNGKFADLSYWSNGIGDMVTTVEDGVATMTFEGTTSNRYNQDIRQSVAIYANHKYFFAVDVYSDDVNQCNIILYTPAGSKTVIHTMQLGQWSHASGITTMVAEASGSSLFRLGTIEKIGQVTMKFKNVSFYDLTLMFGAGNEPTTEEEFYQRLPVGIDHSEYNAGELIPFNADAIKSVGDNAWDEEWEVGSLYADTGKPAVSSSAIRPKNFIKVLPNTQYYIVRPFEEYLLFYDENQQFISSVWVAATTTFLTPSNCKYMKFRAGAKNGATYNNNIIISLVHSGWKAEVDGGYKPYWDFVREIDPRIKDAFPEGMKPWDKVYNKNGKGVIVKGSRVVDMGTLDWIYNDTYGVFYANGIKHKQQGKSVCSKYPYFGPYNEVPDKGLGYIWYENPCVRDTSYTDAASFKAAMAGVMLWYELATPEIIEYDEPFNLDYEVADFGTEEIISEQPSAPINANIAYGFNAVDQIRNNADEIAQLKATIAQLQEALASMVDNNIEE